jgi:hypothetical protein
MAENKPEDNGMEGTNLEVKCAYASPVVNERTGYESKLSYRCGFGRECPLKVEFFSTGLHPRYFCGAQLNPRRYRFDPNKKTIVKPGNNPFRDMLDSSKPKDEQD